MKLLKISTLLLAFTLFACNSNGEPDQDNASEAETSTEVANESENTVEAEEDGGRSTLVQALAAEETPESLELLEGDLENVLLHYRRADEPAEEDGDDLTYLDFLYFEDDQLTVGYTNFDSSTDSPVLGSSDFEEYTEEYSVNSTELTNDQFVIETDSEVFTFARDADELIDEQGNPFQVYQVDISEYLKD